MLSRKWPSIGLILVALGVAAGARASVRIQGRDGRLDLLVIGFAVFQTNLADELDGLFDAEDALPAELAGRQIMNVRMEGALLPGVQLDAKVLHDRENLRDWRYRLRLSGQRNELELGELAGAFEDTLFTRFDTPFYGLAGKLGIGALDARAFVTERAGNRRVDRLRGTNLSGPYVLSASPVLEGSERVVIEIRDRRDDERVLSSNALVPGRDYVVDYLTGTIQFDEPVEAESFDGDPVHIVIEYEFKPRDGATIDYLAGTRLGVEVTDGITLGATYLRSTGSGTDALAGGMIGLDQRLDLGRVVVESELAGPAGDVLDRNRGALQVGVLAKPSKSLEVSARLRRVGAELPTAADPRLESDLDRQHWELKTTFLPSPEHRFEAGYDLRSDNVAGDPAVDTLRVGTAFVGWKGRLGGWPQLGVRLERRRTHGASSSELGQLQVDAEDELGVWSFLGPVTMRAQYRYETEAIGEAGAEGAHTTRMRLDADPLANLALSLEARRAFGSREGFETIFGSRWTVDDNLATTVSLRHRRDGRGDAASRTTTASFDLRWELSTRLRAAVKYEWSLRGDASGEDDRTRNLFGHVTVTPVRGLSATFGYELDDRGVELGGAGASLDGEYVMSLRFDRIDGFQLFGRLERGFSEERLPPFEATSGERRTALLGFTYDVTEDWSVLAQVKREWLVEPVSARREATVLELSRALNRFLRLGGGVELTLNDEGEVSRLDRNRLYLKLIGRL